jgi:hypothetical protein
MCIFTIAKLARVALPEPKGSEVRLNDPSSASRAAEQKGERTGQTSFRFVDVSSAALGHTLSNSKVLKKLLPKVVDQ